MKIEVEMKPLPRWNPAWSDGCSGLQWFRVFAKWLNLEPCRKCCERHDRAYYFGGTKAARLKADLDLRACFIHEAKMPVAIAQICFAFTRTMGAPGARIKGVSWAWGNERFEYNE